MKRTNERRNEVKAAEAAVTARRVELTDFIGQAVANQFGIEVMEFSHPHPDLVVEFDGQQFEINISARQAIGRSGNDRRMKVEDAAATFIPE